MPVRQEKKIKDKKMGEKKMTQKNDFIFLSTIFLSTNSRIENKSVSGKSGKNPPMSVMWTGTGNSENVCRSEQNGGGEH